MRFQMDAPRTQPLRGSGARQLLQRALNNADRAIAEEANRIIHSHLGQVMKHPTGEYLSRVVVVRGPDGYYVWDRRSVKGPWLETGRRRGRPTRFRGYAAFRRAEQQMQRKAKQIAEREINKELRRSGL